MRMLVNVSAKEYNGEISEPLTYWTDSPIQVGQIVIVPIRRRQSLGVVVELNPTVAKDLAPKCKPITSIIPHPVLPESYIALAKWLGEYYAASSRSVWQTMLPSGLAAKPRQALPAPSAFAPPQFTLTLTDEQKKALEDIRRLSPEPILLHGVTGSGKTELFARLAADTLKSGHSVLILVPEIGLTPQKVAYFQKYFKKNVTVTHSRLTAIARRNIWLSVLANKEPQVVIGPRSALFLPFANLGLLVVDEEHEPTYKQESAPRYNATHVAGHVAKLHNAQLILASATPTVSDYYLAGRGLLKLITLAERVHKQPMPNITIATLKKGEPPLSEKLIASIKTSLIDGKQSLLFLNRRGSASACLCTNCNEPTRCPVCQTIMVFHETSARLQCHVCDFSSLPPTKCIHCGVIGDFIFVGAGTQKIERLIQKQFSDKQIVRLDSDSMAGEDINELIKGLEENKAQIIIGTQIIAKGHDLPNIGLVGIVLAEQSLLIPDFSANERTFNLITQVAGRTGRNKDSIGNVILQTYAPNNPIIRRALAYDYTGFYKEELANRKKYLYPPFVFLLKMTITKKSVKLGFSKAQAITKKLQQQHTDILILGPSQPARPAVSGGTRWQVIVKSKNRTTLVEIAKAHSSEWTIDLDPITII